MARSPGRRRDPWADSRTAPILALYTRSPFGTVLWSGDIRPLNIGSEYAPPEDVEGTVVLRRRTLDQLFNHNEIPLSDYVVAPHCRGSRGHDGER